MNQESLPPLTPLDVIAAKNELQIMKALVPYLPHGRQKSFAVLIKLMEIQNLLDFFGSEPDLTACGMVEPAADPAEILREAAAYAFPSDRERLSQGIQIFEVMQMMQAMGSGMDTEELLQNFLTPEQRKMFEAYQNLNL